MLAATKAASNSSNSATVVVEKGLPFDQKGRRFRAITIKVITIIKQSDELTPGGTQKRETEEEWEIKSKIKSTTIMASNNHEVNEVFRCQNIVQADVLCSVLTQCISECKSNMTEK